MLRRQCKRIPGGDVLAKSRKSKCFTRFCSENLHVKDVSYSDRLIVATILQKFKKTKLFHVMISLRE